MSKNGTLEEHDAAVTREMMARGELTRPAAHVIDELAGFGHDVRAYYSASGRPFVWAFDRRYTAAEWNAHVEQRSLDLLTWLALPARPEVDVGAMSAPELLRFMTEEVTRIIRVMKGD